jgi:uncharacterized protein YndB with AHSA1/START domain
MDVVVSKEIAASPDVVWAMVSDLTRMGEWSPENKGGQWIKGATGAAVGASFKGRNSNGKKSWSTTVKVTEFEPSKKISFALMVGPSAWCDWVWEVAPSATGTLVTHSWIDRRGWFANWLGGKVSGVTDRASHNRANMERTLESLAGAVRGS